MTKTHVCPGCHGVVAGTRKFKIDTAIKNHQASCPTKLRLKEQKQ